MSKDDFSWVTNINLPKIRIEGIYTMKGRILILPLNGRGKCWLEPSEFDLPLTFDYLLLFIFIFLIRQHDDHNEDKDSIGGAK